MQDGEYEGKTFEYTLIELHQTDFEFEELMGEEDSKGFFRLSKAD